MDNLLGKALAENTRLSETKRPIRMTDNVFWLSEGFARLQFPSDLSPDSAEFLEEWLEIILRGVRRRANAAAQADTGEPK